LPAVYAVSLLLTLIGGVVLYAVTHPEVFRQPG